MQKQVIEGLRGKGTRIAAVLACFCLSIGGAPSADAADESFVDGLAAYDAGDVVETVRIWQALAEIGDPRAQVGLAGLHLAGSGVARDPIEAARLYRRAAEQGDSNGQLNLGRLYLSGVGIEADNGKAYAWLTMAARQGRRWAEERRQEIAPTLSVGERAAAEALIEDIQGR